MTQNLAIPRSLGSAVNGMTRKRASRATSRNTQIGKVRQTEAVKLRLAGLTCREIGERLGISEKNAWKHLRNALVGKASEVEVISRGSYGHTVYPFSKDGSAVSDLERESIPVDLESVASELQELRPIPGVYFLLSGNAVVYVGQSRDVPRRIVEHRRDKFITFERVVYVACGETDLRLRVEAWWIRKLRPRYNRSGQLGVPPRMESHRDEVTR